MRLGWHTRPHLKQAIGFCMGFCRADTPETHRWAGSVEKTGLTKGRIGLRPDRIIQGWLQGVACTGKDAGDSI